MSFDDQLNENYDKTPIDYVSLVYLWSQGRCKSICLDLNG